MVTAIKSSQQFEDALKSDKLVVVDFFSTTCGPCKMIAPIIEKFAAQYTEADFLKVDCDEVSDLAAKYEIAALPTFLFFKKGEQIHKVVGANPAGVKTAVAANL